MNKTSSRKTLCVHLSRKGQCNYQSIYTGLCPLLSFFRGPDITGLCSVESDWPYTMCSHRPKGPFLKKKKKRIKNICSPLVELHLNLLGFILWRPSTATLISIWKTKCDALHSKGVDHFSLDQSTIIWKTWIYEPNLPVSFSLDTNMDVVDPPDSLQACLKQFLSKAWEQ